MSQLPYISLNRGQSPKRQKMPPTPMQHFQKLRRKHIGAIDIIDSEDDDDDAGSTRMDDEDTESVTDEAEEVHQVLRQWS